MARRDLWTKLKYEWTELKEIKKEYEETKKKASELWKELCESVDKFKRILEEIAENEFGEDEYVINISYSDRKVNVLRSEKHECGCRCNTEPKDKAEIIKTIKFEELE